MPQLTRLAAFAKKNAGRLATGAVVCLCAAALLLPGVLGAARQAQLLGQVQPRPAVAGVPSEQARSIPLLYDLYRRQAGQTIPGNSRRSWRFFPTPKIPIKNISCLPGFSLRTV